MTKTYICPECGKESTADEWNKATISWAGTCHIDLIDNEEARKAGHFICPKCQKVIVGKYIKEGEQE